ncbi:MAG TPA: M2 family metallopeptidase [Symbiobacteriaceae bacterium]|jgi:peptidyl-dipeptidase A
MTDDLRSLVADLATALRTKTIQMNEAYWRLATTGKAEEAQKAAELEKQLRMFLSDKETFARLKAGVANPTGDGLLDRQVDGLYRSYLENQLAEAEITDLVQRANELEQIFSNFRGTVDGKALSDNDIREILVKSTDNTERRLAWTASKQIGAQIGPKLRDLVKARNKAAQRLGFPNYYEMQLTLSEIKSEDLFRLMNELKQLTDGPFAAMKRELDREQAGRFGVAPEEMRPWHYADPFFQEVPRSGDIVDLNPYFEGKRLEDLATRFYTGVGLDVTDILARSDLYERPGKNQHAFCTDIDHEGDIRTLCNLKPNTYWMSTLLHELGHGVYDKYVDPALPWLLRQNAHINSTEAIAMYFGRQTRDSDWLHQVAAVPEETARESAGALHKEQSASMQILVRWVLVMVFFESAMYQDPDQDLNGLWWGLVKEMQMVTPPAAELNGWEWAAKIHLGTAPVYYHNYLIGEVTASHLQAYIARETGTPRIVANPGVGKWLVERFFKPGALYPWNTLVEHATGEPLNPRYFVDQFVK